MGGLFAPLLGPTDLVYTPGDPEFQALVASTLGNQGDPADGFESAFSALLSVLPDPSIVSSTLDARLGEISPLAALFNAGDEDVSLVGVIKVAADLNAAIDVLSILGAIPGGPVAMEKFSLRVPAAPAPGAPQTQHATVHVMDAASDREGHALVEMVKG